MAARSPHAAKNIVYIVNNNVYIVNNIVYIVITF